jgi:primary-amine oxidase
MVTSEVATGTHPLDPLSATEIQAAADLVRVHPDLSDWVSFVSLILDEPTRDELARFAAGEPVERRCVVIMRDRRKLGTFRAVVSLSRGCVAESQWVDAQPSMTVDETDRLAEILRADERYQQAMARRGIHDMARVAPQIFPAGYQGPEDDPLSRRIVRPVTYLRDRDDDNPWARPVDGIHVVFDCDKREVAEVIDEELVAIAERKGNFAADRISEPENYPCFPTGSRQDVRPLEVVQPNGPSFEVDGNAIRWQKWQFRIGFNAREGLVLYMVGYNAGDGVRSILHRASVSELWVPYGDPSKDQYRKNAMDVGECGFGVCATSLDLGCDCLGEIRYFDATVNGSDGAPLLIKNAVCLHEEDAGIAWKHTMEGAGHSEVRRLRRLVISFVANVGNYVYGIYWYLYQDGMIEFETKLTGIISPGAVRDGTPPRHGTLVAPGVYGPHHQHFFNIRLDVAIDGFANSVYECDSVPLPLGEANPYGNAWEVKERLMERESVSQSVLDARRARYWKIVNPNVANALGQPVGFRLVPGHNAFPLLDESSYGMRRGGFAKKHVWVTRYEPGELFAAGDYPAQHPGGAGLPAYVQADRCLENTDVVVWYTLGAHHVVRPEDWPVMPVTRIGFALTPDGFFDGNPGLDLPVPSGHCHHDAGG